MTTQKELLEKGYIGVDDEITFRTHADALRLFGRDHKIFQKAFAKHPHEPGVHIWFPVFYQDDDNAWENTWSQNEETAFERRKVDNEAYLNEQFDTPERHTRVLFAKIAPFGKVFYKFKGVYKFDPELSLKARKAAYRYNGKSIFFCLRQDGGVSTDEVQCEGVPINHQTLSYKAATKIPNHFLE